MNDKRKQNSYVLHVKKGFEDREKSIIEQFSRLGMSFEQILDYDKEEINPGFLETYKYGGNFNIEAIFCALKHISAWEQIAQADIRYLGY